MAAALSAQVFGVLDPQSIAFFKGAIIKKADTSKK